MHHFCRRLTFWSAFALTLLTLLRPAVNAASPDPSSVADHDGVWLIAGRYTFNFLNGEPVRLVADRGPFTGFAFGPGRAELAYCAPARQTEQSGLWVTSVVFSPMDYRTYVDSSQVVIRATPGRDLDAFPQPEARAPLRLLWTAPPGVVLRGPIWWAPNGSRIALRAYADGARDLVAVDYRGEHVIWFTRGKCVTEAVWGPQGGSIAYVTDEVGGKALWVQTIATGEARRVGEAGFNLRWSLDGRLLTWLRPGSDTNWVQVTWDAEAERAMETNPQPARHEGTLWSPNDRLTATLEPASGSERRHLVFHVGSQTAGDVVVLPGIPTEKLLGWSPDGRVVLVAEEAGVPFAVAGRATPDELLSIAKSQVGHQPGRIALAGLPVNLEAGPPAWSSYCDKLAYVVAGDIDQAFPVAEEVKRLRGCLVAAGVSRRDWEPEDAARQAAYIEEARAVTSNLKHIMMAVTMFAEDQGGMLPDADDAEELSEILAPYVPSAKGAGVFARPGGERDLVVEYLAMPGMELAEIEDPQLTAIAIVDYHPMFYVVGYADGHVRLFHR